MHDRPRVSRACWCGEGGLSPYSAEYGLCPACGTLVSRAGLADAQLAVRDDERDFYGKEYWLSHYQGLHKPTIEGRARADLPVRCTHWLRTLLRYRLPPARVLELGAAHGGGVALLRWAGYDAVGLEVSPWVADFARAAFGVPMLVGPVEGQDVEPASLDAVVLYDVLEHLPDPQGTLRRCAQLLKPDGLLVIQTPQFPEGRGHEDLRAANDPFLEMMAAAMADEHLYLFSRRSVAALLGRLGFGWVRFEPPAHVYDMYLLASRREHAAHSDAEIGAALERTPSGRMTQALLDARAEVERQAQRAEQGKGAFHDLQTQAQAALADLYRHVQEGQAALAGTRQGAAAMERELEERRKEIAHLRERLADRSDLGPYAIRCARQVQQVVNRFPRMAGAMRKILKRAG